MRLDRAGIASRVPHAGEMCLLDEVLEWNAQRIRCRSDSHRRAGNPLRGAGGLGAACAVEYAAQAAALHGALVCETGGAAGSPPAPGRLASVRDLRLRIARLDDVPHRLWCEVVLVANDSSLRQYAFEVGDERASTPWVAGRLSIVTAPAGDATG